MDFECVSNPGNDKNDTDNKSVILFHFMCLKMNMHIVNLLGNQIHRHMQHYKWRDKDCCSGGQNDLKTQQKNITLFFFFFWEGGGGSWTRFHALKLMKSTDGCSEHNRYQMKSILLFFF